MRPSISRYLDVASWPRRAAFEFFRGFDNPYFNICVSLDVGALAALSSGAPKIPFGRACEFLALRVAQEYEPFRYRLAGGQVLVHDRLHAASIVLGAGDQLSFVYFDYAASFAEFQRNAAGARSRPRSDGSDIGDDAGRTDVIHFSSLPWISFTSISHARNWKQEDSIPKITFGKYHRSGGAVGMPVSVEVHHALMDGIHVARYLEQLQAALLAPAEVLDP